MRLLKIRNCCRGLSNSKSITLTSSHYPAITPVEKQTPVILLHGLFGSKQNFTAIARALSKQLNTDVYTLDLRNHGDAPWTDTMSIEEMSSDVSAFITSNNLSQTDIVGGKVALDLTVSEHRVRKSIIVDMNLTSRSLPSTLFRHYIHQLQSIDLAKAKMRIFEELEEQIPQSQIRSFLLTNLKTNAVTSKRHFQCNLATLDTEMDTFKEWICEGRSDREMLFLYGKRGGYVTEESYASIREQFSNASFLELDTGHWVHSERPQEFIAGVVEFLKSKE